MVIGSSDHDVSRILENWLMKNDPGPLQGDNKCWFDFLKATDIDVTEMVSRDYILKNNWEAISKLASGNHLLWGNNRSNNGNIARLRKMICEYVLAQKHHQQSGEAVVRDMGICTQTRQDEISGSSLTTFCSLVIFSQANHKIRETNGKNTSKPNLHRDKESNARTIQAQK